jgi:uncharacterized protein involved in outer membrane biogenesis
MKKIAVRVLIVIVVILVALIATCYVMMNSIVKKSVETMGPKVAGVDIKLGGVKLSPFSGKGEITGLVVGNPAGFKAPTAITIGSASVVVQPASLISDKIVVRSVIVHAPDITFESSLSGNNLNKILANVEAATAGSTSSTAPGEKKAAKKIEVDDFVITGGKIHINLTLMGGESTTIPLPEIHLTNLGAGADGMTGAELSQKVLKAITDNAIKAVDGTVTGLGKGATEGVEKATKSITDIFKNK